MKLIQILLLCFYLVPCYSQSFNEEPLVSVGNLIITADEFQQRYEMTPLFRKQVKRWTEALKLEFLYTIIAEKLWAMDAYQKGYNKNEVMQFSEKTFEKMFIRDALYHQEIKSKIEITEEQFIEGYLRSTQKLFVNFLFSEDEEEINSLYNFLNNGFPFDTILAESPELDEQFKPIEITFGQMEKFIEDSLYNLKVGEYTTPVFTKDGWYIFRLTNKTETLLLTEKDKNNALSGVKKIIEAQKEKELYYNFYQKFFAVFKIDVDGELIKNICKNISLIFAEKKKVNQIGNDESIYLSADDILLLEDSIGEKFLALPLVKLESETITLKEFIRYLAFDGFSLQNYDIESVFKLIDSKMRTFIEYELLAKEGYKRNLDKLPDVQKQVNMWKENYLYQFLQSQFLDSVSVSEEEAYQYYLSIQKEEKYPTLVNIIEIFTDSIEIVEKIMIEMEKGIDFREIALKYNKRESTKKNGGEYGLFSIHMHGDIGRVAAKMEIGGISDPIKIPEGFSIFKLIDKQNEKTIPPKPFEKFKNEYIRELGYNKARIKMINFTVNLALKYGVSINFELLKTIPVTNINAFGFRHLGFGGRLTAAPLIAPDIDWVDKWIDKLQIIQ